MKQLVTQAIILSRTDYGEADRILTVLTPDYGKLRLLAKGVRKVRSKLAGGIELFSVSEITFIKGRSDICTVVSTRLQVHYTHIVHDLERTMAAYDIMKRLHRLTEDEAEAAYFYLLQGALAALNESLISLDIVLFWFNAQVLQQEGQAPNLHTDGEGKKLDAIQQYTFSFDRSAFMPDGHGQYGAAEIKFLRLAFASRDPRVLQQVQGVQGLLKTTGPLMTALQRQMA